MNGLEERELIQGEIEEEVPKTLVPNIGDLVELDLKSVIGFSTPRSMKIKGLIEEKEIMILITHNFIAQRLIKELGLPLTETSNYKIVMGKKSQPKGRGL